MLWYTYHPVDADVGNCFSYDDVKNKLRFTGYKCRGKEYKDEPTGLFYKYLTLCGAGNSIKLFSTRLEQLNAECILQMEYSVNLPVLYLCMSSYFTNHRYTTMADSNAGGIRWYMSLNSTFDNKKWFLRLPFLVHDYLMKTRDFSVILDNTLLGAGIPLSSFVKG